MADASQRASAHLVLNVISTIRDQFRQLLNMLVDAIATSSLHGIVRSTPLGLSDMRKVILTICACRCVQFELIIGIGGGDLLFVHERGSRLQIGQELLERSLQ